MGSPKHAPSLIAGLLIGLSMAAPMPAVAADWLKPKTDDDLLSADEAIQLQAAVWQDGELSVGLDAAKGVYLYRDKISIEALQPTSAKLGQLKLPDGEPHHDDHFGDVRVLRGSVLARAAAAHAPQQVRVRYQGCAENRVCYPPQTRILTVEKLN